jgi:hypothetical protein
VVDEYGDPEVDLDAAMADAVLHELLGDIPSEAFVADAGDRAASIEALLAAAWPNGIPPTVEELAADPENSAFMEAMGTDEAGDADVGESDAADDSGHDVSGDDPGSGDGSFTGTHEGHLDAGWNETGQTDDQW